MSSCQLQKVIFLNYVCHHQLCQCHYHQCQHVICLLSPSLCCCKTITLTIYLPLAMFLPSHRVNFQPCLCFNYFCGIICVISVSVISVSVGVSVTWCGVCVDRSRERISRTVGAISSPASTYCASSTNSPSGSTLAPW